MSNFENSQSLNLTNTPEKIEQSEIDHGSTDRSLGLEDSLVNIKTDDNLKISSKKNNHSKFPMTEWSKREMTARIRIEREKKLEQTKIFNQKIIRGAEVIKNHSKKNRENKAESLTKINTNLLHQDESLINCTDPLSPSLNSKIKALESNLKKLEIELIMEKNKCISEKKCSITDFNQNLSVPDENMINKSDEIIVKDHSNTTTKYLDESKYKELCTLNKSNNEIIPNLETRLSFNPKHIEFGVLRMNLNLVKGVLKQQIKVSNPSKNNISCRYSHILDPNSVLVDDMNIIKVKSASWCRLYSGMTVDYALTFKPVELPNSLIYLNLQGVKLVFETVTNNQPNVKYVFFIPVKFCMVKPEPELITKTITFPIVRDSSENINPKNYLILKNNGNAECVFSVIKESDYQKTQNFDYSPSCSTETALNDCNLFECVVDSVKHKMMSEFIVWSDHINVLLPAKGCVRVPVTFHQNLASSSVTESYVIAFDNDDEYSIPNQRVMIVGHIRDQNVLLVKPDVIDVGLCYLTSSAQTANFKLQNNSRVVLPFEIKLPRQLSKHVEFSPPKGYLKTESSMEISVRLCLKYDILLPDCRPYFDADSGFLDVPVRVCSGDLRKCHQILHILAVVDTSFGLRLIPDILDFGTVNTMETVVRNVWLANHSRTAKRYGFLKLPERVSVYPNAFGTIFSGERVLLHVHYSPSAKDMPQNLYTFEDNFILTCTTMTGLNAEKYNSKVVTVEQSNETISEEMSTTSNMNQKIAVNVNQMNNELDHGQDKIQITRLKNVVEVSPLDENSILKEASIRCHAKIHDIPVELSVQQIMFGNTHFTSYSTYKIELRATNLASVIERNICSFPDFKIRFEFVSNDPSVEFKPKNGILRSKEVIQIHVIYRPKLDNELQNKYEEYLNSEAIKIESEQVLSDENSFINNVYRNKPVLLERIKIFQAQILFYSSLMYKTKIISTACFVQFVNQKSKQHFGFDTESLKLSLVCPTTKPNIILFSNKIDFGKCAIDVRHNEWLLIKNVTTRPVPLKISLSNPIGPFFCAFALNGAQKQLFIPPSHTIPINVSFTPEREITVNEVLDVTSGTMRLSVLLCGCGVGPSCKISPDDMFNIIQTTHEHLNSTIIFRVTNTSGASVRFNVQMEWAKERMEPMVDDEAHEFVDALRTASASVRDDVIAATKLQQFVFEDWTGLDVGADHVFDLENGGRPLRFRLDRNSSRYVYVTFRPPTAAAPVQARSDVQGASASGPAAGPREYDDDDGFNPVFRRRAYAAKFNVHVAHSVLQRFFVLGFVDETY